MPSQSAVLQNTPLFCKFLIVTVLVVFYFMNVLFDYVNHGAPADFLLSPPQKMNCFLSILVKYTVMENIFFQTTNTQVCVRVYIYKNTDVLHLPDLV